MWIGDRESPEFADAFAYCEEHVSQIAYRSSLRQAVKRPASCVSKIVLTRSWGTPVTGADLEALRRQQPDASLLELIGPRCVADRMIVRGDADYQRCRWHRWIQEIPNWIAAPSGVNHRVAPMSVGVVTATYTMAEPLLDLAAENEVTAVWCPSPNSLSVRGVEMYWWDDSVAEESTAEHWHRRLAACGDASGHKRHVWIANAPSPDQVTQAVSAGIDLVVSKPFQIDRLVETLQVDLTGNTDAVQTLGTESKPLARAA